MGAGLSTFGKGKLRFGEGMGRWRSQHSGAESPGKARVEIRCEGSPGIKLWRIDQSLILALILVRLGVWGDRPRGGGGERNEIY